MHVTTTSSFRRYAAVGTAIAVVSTSSAFGIGATAAVAAETPTASTRTSSLTDVATTPATAVADATATSPSLSPSSDVTPTPVPTDSPQREPETAPAMPAPAPTASAAAPAAVPTATPAATTGTVAISGTATTWRTLTAETTGWPTGTTFTYQWTATEDGRTTEVRGATTTTYVIDPEDAGSTFAVAVTATVPGAGPEVVTSEPRGVVTADETRFRADGTRDLAFTAGDDVSVDRRAFDGDQGGLTYRSAPAAPRPGSVSGVPDGLELTSDGYLVGTPTRAVESEFVIDAVTTRHPQGVGMVVTVDVAAGAPAEVTVIAYRSTEDPSSLVVWTVAPDGSVSYSESPEIQVGDRTTPFRVDQDDELQLHTYVTDAYGNVGVEGKTTWTSSVAGDTFSPVDDGSDDVTLRFAHAGSHVVAATFGALAQSFSVQVDPARSATAPATGPATGPGAGTATPTGQLAFTGADTAGPIAWALGLLASGAVLLLLRVRRRRV